MFGSASIYNTRAAVYCSTPLFCLVVITRVERGEVDVSTIIRAFIKMTIIVG